MTKLKEYDTVTSEEFFVVGELLQVAAKLLDAQWDRVVKNEGNWNDCLRLKEARAKCEEAAKVLLFGSTNSL
jgi:3-methyladenine DNA glycosylase AlkD